MGRLGGLTLRRGRSPRPAGEGQAGVDGAGQPAVPGPGSELDIAQAPRVPNAERPPAPRLSGPWLSRRFWAPGLAALSPSPAPSSPSLCPPPAHPGLCTCVWPDLAPQGTRRVWTGIQAGGTTPGARSCARDAVKAPKWPGQGRGRSHGESWAPCPGAHPPRSLIRAFVLRWGLRLAR